MEVKKYQLQLKDKIIEVEFSNLAEQANGSVLVKIGGTCVLANAVMGKNDRLDIDFFPLLVDHEEKYYAAGKIYGSRFVRRESRPTEVAVLTSRLIDRTIRPLFPETMRRDVQVVVTCLSIDEKNDPDVLSIIAASLALSVSDIPFNGPVSALRVGWSKEKGFVLNPWYEEREVLEAEVVVSGPRGQINMIEGGAKGVKEEIIKEAFLIAQKEIASLNDQQEKIIKEIGKEKQKIVFQEIDKDFKEEVSNFLKEKIEKVLNPTTKKERLEELEIIKEELDNYLKEKEYSADLLKQVSFIFNDQLNQVLHKNILEKELRPDGRKLNEIRPLEMKIDIFDRLHGSAIFMRGLTHALSVVTLGAPSDALLVQGMEITGEKRFMHHYNFPGYSSGEVSPLRGPGRREIGHGALAERALVSVIPRVDDFPYTIRVVSEILSSNGSTSMASVCASSLALMASGVPVSRHVAGIAMGLIIDEKTNNYKILTDIQGPEDHFGDMDFKVAGTELGITALQMDMKVEGVLPNVLSEALDKAKEAREYILEKMNQVISSPREELSPYAPRVFVIKIKPEKIGDLIGPGGKVINSIIQNLGVQIDIKEDGTVFVTAPDKEKANLALEEIKDITKEFSEGEVVKGKVSQIKEFGAIVDLGHHKEGLLHISELAPFRVNRVEDIVQSGEELKLKIKKVEQNGKISLSLKDVNPSKEKQNKFFRKDARKSFPRKK